MLHGCGFEAQRLDHRLYVVRIERGHAIELPDFPDRLDGPVHPLLCECYELGALVCLKDCLVLVPDGWWCQICGMTTSPTPDQHSRPTAFTDATTDELLGLLCEGRSLREICEADHLPSLSTVYRRLHSDPVFQARYAAARATGAEAMADEVIELGRNATSENAAGIRVRVDTVKWAAARLAPKRWGDRVSAELSGPGGTPLTLQAVAPPLVPREVRASMQALLAEAEAAAGLPSPGTATDAERLKAIMATGEMTAELYASLHDSPDAP